MVSNTEQTVYPSLPELTFRGMFLGMLITVIFTASNVYLGLKVGLTFSSSIPAAVISMAILRMFKDSNILENNMVQTQASAAGTLSAIIFILPGLLMIGYWQGFPFWANHDPLCLRRFSRRTVYHSFTSRHGRTQRPSLPGRPRCG
ncbi:hypothetical protein HMPREF0080_01611 [Anaeroglobus geminatus F0357]|uniref:Oligopeptide transporter, OPT family n=1 Tax=Anaeroglobus geminatus F0357 TaxID=861450 RepID=G9YIW7_9FIRM|nr:hypothetical protein HMPREF0080_01611 [Anaeroglobus geminatus F0357]